jgi:hypothetical protein
MLPPALVYKNSIILPSAVISKKKLHSWEISKMTDPHGFTWLRFSCMVRKS